MSNFKLTLSYDGTRYRGWQRLGDTDNTIQNKVETALSRLLDQDVSVSASGRTDAGVHARHQVCSFQAETGLSCPALLSSLRQVLPRDIGALSLETVPPRFHARYQCVRKTYVYRVWNSEEPNVFERNYLYVYPAALDLDAMQKAASLLCGEHDYSSFTSAKHMKKTAVRRVDSIECCPLGPELRIVFCGDGFLYNMVRILTGTLLEVGTGRRSSLEMSEILASRRRENAGFLVPAGGLTLWDVEY